MDFKCLGCNKQFDQFQRIPRVIQCGHSYCDRCIRQFRIQKKNSYTCVIDGKTQILRKQSEQLPKNQEIIKALKELKHQNLSKSRMHMVLKNIQIQNKKIEALCEQHKKIIEFHCKTDGKLLCSYCAILGQHKTHEFQPLVKVKQEELFQQLKSVQSQIQDLRKSEKGILEQPNCIQKNFEYSKKQLRNYIKQLFKCYHQIINRKQVNMSKEIQQIFKIYQKKEFVTYEDNIEIFRKKYSNIVQQIGMIKDELTLEKKLNNQFTRNQISDLTEQIKKLKCSIQKIQQQVKDKCESIVMQYKQKFKDHEFFKIQESFFSFSNAKKQEKVETKDSRIKTKLSQSKTSSLGQSKISTMQNQKNLILSRLQVEFPMANMIQSKQSQIEQKKVNTFKTSINFNFNSEDIKKKSQAREMKTSVSKVNKTMHEKNILEQKKQLSPQHPEHLEIKKQKKNERGQLKYQVRQKIDQILQIIDKFQGFNLELIGLDIKDIYLNSIFDFIKKEDKKFGIIKIIMNAITDQGFQIILDKLQTDQITHTLHLTSNQLTQVAIDKIINFGQKNKILKKFSLMKNHISKIKIKDKLNKLCQMGIQVSL